MKIILLKVFFNLIKYDIFFDRVRTSGMRECWDHRYPSCDSGGCRHKKKRASRAPSTVSRSTDASKEHPWLLDGLGIEKREKKKTHLARRRWVSSSEARMVVEDIHIPSSSSEEEFDAEEKADIGQALDEWWWQPGPHYCHPGESPDNDAQRHGVRRFSGSRSTCAVEPLLRALRLPEVHAILGHFVRWHCCLLAGDGLVQRAPLLFRWVSGLGERQARVLTNVLVRAGRRQPIFSANRNGRMSGLPIRAKNKHYRTLCEYTFGDSPTDVNSCPLNWLSYFWWFSHRCQFLSLELVVGDSPDKEEILCTTVELFCLQIQTTFPRTSLPVLSCRKTTWLFAREVFQFTISQLHWQKFLIQTSFWNCSAMFSSALHSRWVHPKWTWSNSPKSTCFISTVHIGSMFSFFPAILMSSTYTEIMARSPVCNVRVPERADADAWPPPWRTTHDDHRSNIRPPRQTHYHRGMPQSRNHQ